MKDNTKKLLEELSKAAMVISTTGYVNWALGSVVPMPAQPFAKVVFGLGRYVLSTYVADKTVNPVYDGWEKAVKDYQEAFAYIREFSEDRL